MGRIEQNRQIERDRAVLERILALLLALAGLADRAAALPAPERLLAILGFGEEVAREFVFAIFGAPADIDDAVSPPAGHAERLTARFRMLALAVGALLATARRLAGALPHESGLRNGLPVTRSGPARPIAFRRAGKALVAPDTS
jgi:hypothetical protein